MPGGVVRGSLFVGRCSWVAVRGALFVGRGAWVATTYDQPPTTHDSQPEEPPHAAASETEHRADRPCRGEGLDVHVGDEQGSTAAAENVDGKGQEAQERRQLVVVGAAPTGQRLIAAGHLDGSRRIPEPIGGGMEKARIA